MSWHRQRGAGGAGVCVEFHRAWWWPAVLYANVSGTQSPLWAAAQWPVVTPTGGTEALYVPLWVARVSLTLRGLNIETITMVEGNACLDPKKKKKRLTSDDIALQPMNKA